MAVLLNAAASCCSSDLQQRTKSSFLTARWCSRGCESALHSAKVLGGSAAAIVALKRNVATSLFRQTVCGQTGGSLPAGARSRNVNKFWVDSRWSQTCSRNRRTPLARNVHGLQGAETSQVPGGCFNYFRIADFQSNNEAIRIAIDSRSPHVC